jgi:rSAM/selenodomain-associated transferase 1
VVGASAATVVAILTRAPSAGGKSRLFAGLGCAPDVRLLRALLLDTIDAAQLPDATRVVYVTPAEALDEMRRLVPPDVVVRAQAHGDLGARMRAAFLDAFALGADLVLLIGSDLPTLPPGALAQARDALLDASTAVALGPTTDGGYYLIAARHVPDALLDGIPWGTARVYDQTRAYATRARTPLIALAAGEDVDTVEDLRRAVASRAPAPRTRAWLQGYEDGRSANKE